MGTRRLPDLNISTFTIVKGQLSAVYQPNVIRVSAMLFGVLEDPRYTEVMTWCGFTLLTSALP